MINIIKNLFKPADRFVIGAKCAWEDIKVGEVFGVSGCFNVCVKESKCSMTLLDTNHVHYFTDLGSVKSREDWFYCEQCYKLPKETQQLYCGDIL